MIKVPEGKTNVKWPDSEGLTRYGFIESYIETLEASYQTTSAIVVNIGDGSMFQVDIRYLTVVDEIPGYEKELESLRKQKAASYATMKEKYADYVNGGNRQGILPDD